MISAAKLAANRANSQKSTGPRTVAGKLRVARNGRNSKGPLSAAGKMRAAQNARRHGLSHSASEAPEFAPAIAELGHAFAEGSADLAAAAAQIDVMRARHARVDLLAAHPLDNLRRVAAIERYEAFARKQRRLAIRALDAARVQSRQEELQNEPNQTHASQGILQNEPNQTHSAGRFCKTN